MKTLFIGGVKSGKSRLAETFVLQTLPRYADKPYYLATSALFDEEMKQRALLSQQRREGRFITIEEPLKLMASLKKCHNTTVLVASVSMWLNNMLHYPFTEARILQELEAVLLLPKDIVLVHNEVGLGVIPDNDLARQFVDLSGKAAQLMGQHCDKVFFCSAGLMLTLKS